MKVPARTLGSDYMHFAKSRSHERFNLATSGVADCKLSDLRLTLEDLELHGSNAYGYAPLLERVAARVGAPVESVVMAGGGCSFANHLAMAALVSPGDEVLVEDPTYELLLSALGYLQANLLPVPRRPEMGWALDPDDFISRITDRTRLIVLTNLHNPTSSLAPEAAIHAIADAADRVGACVLVDEVYLELMFRDGVARTSFRPGGNIVVTSSLTKAYGLSGLRCGWILARPDLAERMRQLNNVFASLPAHVAERMAVVAFDRLPALRDRANTLIDANRASYQELLGDHPALEQQVPAQGTTMFPRLRQGDGDRLLVRLRSDYETSIVPGRFFNRPEHIRIGLAGDIAMTRTGLERLAEALHAR